MACKTEIVNGVLWGFEVRCGNAMITRVSPRVSGDVIIPSMLGGAKVICAQWGTFSDCTKLQSVTIPDDLMVVVNYIEEVAMNNIDSDLFRDCSSLRAINVSKHNPAYKSVNGILLSKGGETLVAVPRGLTHVTIPAGVNKISAEAFRDCDRLKSVKIPQGITIIGRNAFDGCSSLEKVLIPDGVLYIGEGAFRRCSTLKSVTIPASVMTIEVAQWDDDHVFADCNELREISVDARNQTFKSVDGLLLEKDMRVDPRNYGSDVRRKGYTLRRAVPAGLTNLTIPDDVVSICLEAFEGCRELKSLTIPSSMMNISGDVFDDCVGLESVTIPDRLKDDVVPNELFHKGSIPDHLFPQGTKITRINRLPVAQKRCRAPVEREERERRRKMGKKTVKEIINGVKWEFKYIDNYSSALLTKAPSSLSGDVVVPATLGGAPVTAIGEDAFDGCRKLKKVTFPDSVVKCGSSFHDCCRLESITISAGMTNFNYWGTGKKVSSGFFDSSVFKTCGSVLEIGVSRLNPMYKSVNGLLLSKDGETVLAAPRGIRSVILPASVKTIGESAFQDCNKLVSITLPASLKTIGESAFMYCRKLESVTIPNGLETVGISAFDDCSRLKSVKLPESVKSIEEWAFRDCVNLQSVTISAGVENIAQEAFSGCCGLREIVVSGQNPRYESVDGFLLEKNVTFNARKKDPFGDERLQKLHHKGKSLFLAPGQLTDVTIPEGVTCIDSYAFSASSHRLKEITIQEGVEWIEDSVFEECYKLKSVTFPVSVKYIGRWAFLNCENLERVTFPDGMSCVVEDRAFCGCYSLESVTLPAGVKCLEDAFPETIIKRPSK